jgi:hypothetical protein
MPADEQPKWRSPHGHAIASSETDKMSPSEFKKHRENCVLTIENTKLKFQLTEAVKVIKKAKLALGNQAQDGKPKQLESFVHCRDFLAKIGEQNDKR